VRRITKAALGSLAGGAAILAGTQLAGGASGTYEFSGPLVDLQTASDDGPLDEGQARVTIVETADSTQFSLRVIGINLDYKNRVGAHLHTGECLEGNGLAAGPHYNTDVLAGVKPHKVEISTETEAWFDLAPEFEAPDDSGRAFDETTVPFVPVDSDGIMSIVIHVTETDPATGLAGSRQACFPLSVPQWIPAPTE